MPPNDYAAIGESYLRHQIDGTLTLAYRDLPELIARYAPGKKALDFGCGSGRSTRFLAAHGLHVTGVDISPDQLSLARGLDPDGTYHAIERGVLPVSGFDLALSVFVFVEMATKDEMTEAARAIHDALVPGGLFLMVVCAEDFYSGSWHSYSVDYPENRSLHSGCKVKLKFLDVDLEIEDYYWTDADYTAVLEGAGFELLDRHTPKATQDDGIAWKDEIERAPFVVYVARRGG